MIDGDRPDPDEQLVDDILAGRPASGPEEQARRAPYERMIEDLRARPPVAPTPGWEARLARTRAEQKRAAARARTAKLLAIPLAAAAAAAVVLWWWLRRPEETPAPRPALAVNISRTGPPDRGLTAVPGDRLDVEANLTDAVIELRVYRNDSAISFRCPGHPGCAAPGAPGRPLEASFVLDRVGRYRVVAVGAPRAIPDTTGSFDGDLARWNAERFTVHLYDVIEVR